MSLSPAGIGVQVVAVMQKHGEKIGADDAQVVDELTRAVTAVAVAIAESAGNEHARCFNWRDPRDGKVKCASTAAAAGGPVLSVDRGLWQFNSKSHAEISDATADAPGPATDAAYRVSNGFRDFHQWATFSSGLYKAHMDDAKAGVRSAVGQIGTSTWDKVLTSGAADAVAAAVNPLAQLGGFVAQLGDRKTWIRVVEVLGGVVLGLVALFLLRGDLMNAALPGVGRALKRTGAVSA